MSHRRAEKKKTQLTSTPRRVMGLHCFYWKLAQFKTINNDGFVKNWETLEIFPLPFHKPLITNYFKLSQLAIKTMQSHYSLGVLVNWVFFFRLSDGLFWLQVTMITGKKWHKKCIFPIPITLTHIMANVRLSSISVFLCPLFIPQFIAICAEFTSYFSNQVS